MNVELLVNEILRQTTVLIAQLSTAAGLRAPLSHVADQVFLELSKELEAQGLGRKVVADMFGLALRSYQMKVRRINEQPESNLGTLWQELHNDLAQSSATRAELEHRYRRFPAKQIAAALHDMVQSGMAYSSGRGQETLFGLTSAADRRHLGQSAQLGGRCTLCWYLVASGAANTRADLLKQMKVSAEELAPVLHELFTHGQLSEEDGQLLAQRFEVAVGAEQGWETAVLDHFRAVATAIAAKVNRPFSTQSDATGGGTHSFRVHPGHPFASEVYGLLAETRTRTRELWRRVSEYNEVQPPPEGADRVTFYFGQHVLSTNPDEPSDSQQDPTEPMKAHDAK
jgi:hypothetical protein